MMWLQLKYQQQRDQVADMQFDREAQMAQDKAQYDRQWELAQWMAQYGDFSGLAALGVPKGTIDQVSGYWNEMTDLDKQKTLADISATNRRNTYSSRSSGGGKYDSNQDDNGGDNGGDGGVSKIADNGSNSAEWAGIDLNSVLALGYGPISRQELERLVDSGAVIPHQDAQTGLIKVYRANQQNQTQTSAKNDPFGKYLNLR